jgi:nitroreductase
MNFMEIAQTRQSCRSYDPNRAVEPEKLQAILEAAQLSPSACNGQPYKITVCQGENAKAVPPMRSQDESGAVRSDSICGQSGTASHLHDVLRR